MDNSMPAYFKYWGKAEKAEEGKPTRYHLLPYHCLDVAAVTAAWWEASPAIRHGFQFQNAMPVEYLRGWVLFLWLCMTMASPRGTLIMEVIDKDCMFYVYPYI